MEFKVKISGSVKPNTVSSVHSYTTYNSIWFLKLFKNKSAIYLCNKSDVARRQHYWIQFLTWYTYMSQSSFNFQLNFEKYYSLVEVKILGSILEVIISTCTWFSVRSCQSVSLANPGCGFIWLSSLRAIQKGNVFAFINERKKKKINILVINP